MNYTTKQREQYNIDRERACTALGITVNQYNWFRRLGNELNLKYTRSCNGYTQPFFEEQDDKREELWTKQAVDKANKLKLHVYFETDPRGAPLYLDTKPMDQTNYNYGHCIY